MASFIVPVIIALLVATAVLHVMRKRRFAPWLLVLFPVCVCIAILKDLAGGAARIGTAAFTDDQKQLVYFLGLLAMSLLAAVRPKWLWLFWIVWLLDALVCSVFVYLAYFWKVFS